MNQRGFTILEMMLVLLLTGVTAGLVLMSFPDAAQNQLQQQRERLQAQLDYALDRSLQDGLLMGIKFRSDGWSFMILQQGAAESSPLSTGGEIWQGYVWQTWQPRRAAIGGKLPEDMYLELKYLRGQQWMSEHGDRAEPDIFLLPGGEVTPFCLLFRQDGGEAVVGLQVDESGLMTTFEGEVAL
ncbi:type II secretion system minor pseudopilin GspH [Citrobacter portucalensis]|uniref:Type II secretion system protein H n=1 Tax=Citrobacter braakii TaxID=57706 RepID=A0A1V8NT29_CITBR|nr:MULTISPECIES: type II secretion system minor pseudopilin GspH [Citrobacter freundii complex]MDQ9159057.1 type II secretion system minor pseudopilin GspH [Citrobacter portucalensis]OQM39569.1 type II secretion system protein GspH [Citrobacter braakii]